MATGDASVKPALRLFAQIDAALGFYGAQIAASITWVGPQRQLLGTMRCYGAGEQRILLAMELFNAWLDIPAINTVLLLQRTESAVVFL
jgi:hypothetical protein